NWADELNVGAHHQNREQESQIRASIYAAEREIGLGNLSALEDDSPLAPQVAASMQNMPGAPVSNRPLALPSQGLGPASNRGAPEPKKGPSPVLFVLIILVVAGGVAGAWFGGLIPH